MTFKFVVFFALLGEICPSSMNYYELFNLSIIYNNFTTKFLYHLHHKNMILTHKYSPISSCSFVSSLDLF